MSNKEFSNSDDVIDSRDVIARIEELQDAKEEFVLNESMIPEDVNPNPSWEEVAIASNDAESRWEDTDEGQELKSLLALQDQAEGYASDWKYGESLIRDSYFEDYAKELAEDTGAIDKNLSWPNNCIDWKQAARELQMDYTSVEFDGVTYWIR